MQFQTPGADGKLITLTDNLRLGSPEYVTHLANDRSTYRPGDTVRFRSLTLERFSLKPAQEKFHLRYRIVGPSDVELLNKEFASTLVGPQNQALKGPGGEELYCLGAGDFALPADVVEGNYTLSVSEVNERFNEEKRTFTVQRPQPPRFTKDVKFDRASYRAGDVVKVQVQVAPAAARPAGKRNPAFVMTTVVIDGVTVDTQNTVVDKDGRLALEFTLPEQIQKGIGAITLERNDGGPQEKAVHSIPLAVQDLQVEFYPEGGDLIAGVANRVYFQARTPTNKPAAFSGWILDDQGREIAHVETVPNDPAPEVVHGLGSFTFTPKVEGRYRLHIDTPKGIARNFALPTVKPTGVVLHLPQEVAENLIDVRLHNVGKPRNLLVGAYCRGRMLDTKFVRAGADQALRVPLRPMAGVAGVYRITVFEQVGPDAAPEFQPLAERLIYRKSAEKVDVLINTNKETYQAGESVQLTMRTWNEKKTPTPTLAMLTVVDQSALKRADAKAVGLPAHFLLTTEIRNPEDLENADFLLGDHPRAGRSLDLLLGSQGWRRFAEQDPQKFQEKQPQAKQPIFLANTLVVTQFLETEQKEIDKVDQAFVAKAIEMQNKLAETQKQEDGPADLHKEIEAHHNTLVQADQEAAYAEQSLREIRAFFVQFGIGAGLLILLLAAFYFISVGLRRLADGDDSARRWFAAGIGLIGLLFLVGILGTFACNGHVFFDDIGRGGRNFGGKKMPGRPVAGPGNEAPPNFGNPAPLAVIDDEAPIAQVTKRKGDAEAVAKLGGAADPADKKSKTKDARQEIQDDVNLRQNIVAAGMGQDADRQLREQKDYQGILLRNLGRRVQLPAAKDACVVREYAHKHKPFAEAARFDATETICWQPILVMPDGRAEATFDLNGAGTRFQVLVHCNTFDGGLATQCFDITVREAPLPQTK